MAEKWKRYRGVLLLVLKGALIGVGAILPGISGGVLCVAMGVYQPMMALLADPKNELKKSLGFFLPLIIGFAAGVLGLSRVVDWLFRVSPVPAVWLFIGLIAGTLPSLVREADAGGRTKGSIVAGVIAFVLALAGLFLLSRAQGVHFAPSTWVWLLCGVLWGVGFIAPGMSPSSLFIFMGVYQPMAAGIAAISMPVLLPLGLGLMASVLLLSRVMNRLLKTAHAATMHVILGFAVASTIVILPIRDSVAGGQYALYALCFAAGLIVALWMDRANRRMQSEGRKE